MGDLHAVIVSVSGGAAAIVGAWLTAAKSKKKRPEDRDSIVVETAERVVEIVRKELEECLEAREIERQHYTEQLAAQKRIVEQHKKDIGELRKRLDDIETSIGKNQDV